MKTKVEIEMTDAECAELEKVRAALGLESLGEALRVCGVRFCAGVNAIFFGNGCYNTPAQAAAVAPEARP